MKNKLKEMKGITLIALVITIIVLLILAAVSIATLTGENGILTKAGEAEEETRGASVQEARDLWKINQEADRQTTSTTAQTLEQLLNDLESQKLITAEEREIIEETGEVTIGSRTIVFGAKKTIEKLTAGEYVNYIDKNGDTIKCIVLYDTNYNTTNSTDYGVQIITADTVENVQLGNGTGSTQTNNATYFNTARNSYNNAISTLNTKANSYLNTTYASSARCVGSVPNNPSSEASGYFTSSYTYMSSYNGTFKNADTNYTSDWNQMKALNIYNLGKYYWLASRLVNSFSSVTGFNVRLVDTDGNLYSNSLCNVMSSSIANSYGYSHGFRPVFTLKSGIGITGGAGTSDSPYTLN